MRKNKEKSKLRTVLKVMLILAASLLICATTYGIYLTKKAEHAANKAYDNDFDREQSAKREEKVTPIEDNVTVLFIGIDDSETRGQGEDHSRSDSLILATLNAKTKTVKTLSIPRDSYVYIPSVGYEDKINHAHAFSGTLGTIETIENFLDIPIDYYVKLNFDAFIEIVDALGGVEVEVPYDLVELDEYDNFVINLKAGYQKLNGSEALALARTRKQDSDIERGKRQQQILKAIAAEASKPSSLLKYDEVIEAVGNNMKTNMTFSEMKSFLAYLSKGTPSIDSLYLDGEDDWSTGIYYYKLDEQSVEDTKYILKSHLGITQTANDDSNSSYGENKSENALNEGAPAYSER